MFRPAPFHIVPPFCTYDSLIWLVLDFTKEIGGLCLQHLYIAAIALILDSLAPLDSEPKTAAQ